MALGRIGADPVLRDLRIVAICGERIGGLNGSTVVRSVLRRGQSYLGWTGEILGNGRAEIVLVGYRTCHSGHMIELPGREGRFRLVRNNGSIHKRANRVCLLDRRIDRISLGCP